MDPAPVQRPPWHTRAPARSVSSSGLALLPAAGRRADTVAAHVTYAVRIARNRRCDRKHVATLARDSAQAALHAGLLPHSTREKLVLVAYDANHSDSYAEFKANQITDRKETVPTPR
jgi:hypothetical protein